MNNFLHQVYFNNTVLAYIVSILIILVALIVKKPLAKVIATWAYKLIHHRIKNISKTEFISNSVKPLSKLILLIAIYIALANLNFPQQFDFQIRNTKMSVILDKILLIILILAITIFLIKTVRFIATLIEQNSKTKDDVRNNSRQFILFAKDLLEAFIAVLGVLAILQYVFHLNVSGILTGLTVVSAAIALAARESLENLIASFIIFFNKPFYVGDMVKVNNLSGHVEKIGLRSTRIRTNDKTLITVPNKQMVDNPVDNHTMRTKRRYHNHIWIDIHTPDTAVQTLISDTKNLLATHREIEKYEVFFADVANSGIQVSIEYFTAAIDGEVFDKVKQNINFSLLRIINELHINLTPTDKIPANTHTSG